MAWISQGFDNEAGLHLWFNSDTGEMKYGQYGSSLPPDAFDANGTMLSTGWNPNMAVPDGGFTVGQALAPNYLNSGVDLSSPAALSAALTDVAPGYRQPSTIDMSAQIPVDQMRAPSREDPFESLLGAGALAGLGFLSGGFGIGDLWSNLTSGFGNPSTELVASGGNPTQVAGWYTETPTFSGQFDPTLPSSTNAGGVSAALDASDAAAGLGGTNPVGGYVPPGGTVSSSSVNAGMDAADAAAGIGGTPPAPALSIPGYGDIYGSGSQIISALTSAGMTAAQAASAVSGALNGNTSALDSIRNALTGGSSILGGLFGGASSIAERALASAPVFAAIDYARNQNPFDTSRLTSLYDSYNPSSLAYEYDQNTLRGRDQLTSSLQNRGVMGSSFGNMDITNFNTSRDLGRNSLINQGIGQRAQIANNILDADVKSRQLKNQLYGSSLLALGNVFGGRSSPTVNFGG